MCWETVLRLCFGAIHTGSFYSDETNIYKIDPSTIFNTVVSFSPMKALNLQLNVNNLFDTVYYSTTINSTQFIPAEGRNVQFTASLSI